LSTNHLPALKLSYTKRLIALGLTVTIGFFAVLGTVLWDSRERDREQARQAAANLIATISSDIERNLELYDLSLQAVVDGMKIPAFSDLQPEVRRLILFDRAATARDMGSIFVLDKDGSVIIDSRTLTPHQENYSQRDFFVVQKLNPATGLYVSRPWLDDNSEHLIAISRRLFSSDGTFSGAVVGTLRLDYFRRLFEKIKLSGQSAMTLVRDDGSIVMRSPFFEQMIGRSVAGYPLFRKIVSYASGSIEYIAGIDGIKRLYVYQRVGEYPLIISYGLSLESIYADWRQKAGLIGLLMFALCSLNVALIVFLAGAVKRRSQAEHQLAITATTDGLTGLCNRRRLDEMFDLEWHRAMRTQNPVALLMIDADNFKHFNDQFGHQAGDAALIALAHCIQDNTQRASDISARYGGEEFAILLPATSLADAVHLAENIRSSVLSLRADQQGRPDSSPTVSIGAASMVPRQGLQPRDLIKAADTALYQAKSKGRNRTEPALPVRTVERKYEAA
jgi:diguanylate cyclase (GGDEF)-like protein